MSAPSFQKFRKNQMLSSRITFVYGHQQNRKEEGMISTHPGTTGSVLEHKSAPSVFLAELLKTVCYLCSPTTDRSLLSDCILFELGFGSASFACWDNYAGIISEKLNHDAWRMILTFRFEFSAHKPKSFINCGTSSLL